MFRRCMLNITSPTRLAITRNFTSKYENQLREVIQKFKSKVKDPWKDVIASCGQKIELAAHIITKHCHFVATQRIRRTAQIINLYSKIYDEKTLKDMVRCLGRQFLNSRKRPICFLFGASLFQWEKDRISDEEIDSSISDMDHVSHLKDNSNKYYMDSWDCIIENTDFKVWRKSIPDTYLYQYKVYGTFRDVSPKDFYAVQVDLEYRKKWDNLIIHLDMVDKDSTSDSEVIRWVTYYPYPMYSREYIFVRRFKIDYKNQLMILISHATDHPSCPVNNKYVRVTTYDSQMVIHPHTTFEENGLDYVLTYYDDPQSVFPTPAYNWMAKTGVSDFCEKLHMAAKNLHDKDMGKRKGAFDDNGTNSKHLPSYS